MKLYFILLALPFKLLSQQVVVSAAYEQYVYSNIPNKISIGYDGVNPSEITIETDNGSVINQNGIYYWTPVGEFVYESHLFIFRKSSNKDKELIQSLAFSVHDIGIPEVRLDCKEGMEGRPIYASIKGLRLDYGVYSKDLNLDSLCKIESFKVELKDIKPGIDTIILFQGNSVSNTFHTLYDKLRGGATVRFFDIYISARWKKSEPFLYDQYFGVLYEPVEFSIR